jgi:hypothetical protein
MVPGRVEDGMGPVVQAFLGSTAMAQPALLAARRVDRR